MAGMSDHVRAFWVAAPGLGEIRSEPMPSRREGDVVVRTLFSGISRGTESLVFNGHVPVSEYQRMRAPFQDGDFPAPVKYGYASVGIVEEGSPELAGRPVFVLYPHQTRYAVPASWVHPIPPDVPPARAVLAANLETAINGLWDAQPRVGDRITVIGAGTVGCLVAWLAGRIPGCRVELVDVNPERASIARSLGVAFADPAGATEQADLVLHVSGSGAGLHTALRVAGFEAKIVEMSWYGDASITVPLGEAFHARRLTLASSQVGHIPPGQHARWSTRRRMALALDLLADPVLDALITGESDFDSLPAVMAELAVSRSDALCHRVRYPGSR
jgi:threonine dehydrogenase-like Zn-dependent dehydrogenase